MKTFSAFACAASIPDGTVPRRAARRPILAIGGAPALSPLPGARAQGADAVSVFYKDNTPTWIGSDAGGRFSASARTMRSNMARRIPGTPRVIYTGRASGERWSKPSTVSSVPRRNWPPRRGRLSTTNSEGAAPGQLFMGGFV